MAPVLTPPLLAVLSGLIRDQTGLHYGPRDLDLLADRVAARSQEAGFVSVLDYYYHLRYDDPDGAEMRALADALVVNESYFFRELEQLDVIVRRFIPDAIERSGQARVWSAACAGGEEPLTLAMLLADRGLLQRTQILASDLSQRALARASAGVYTPRALRRDQPPPLAHRFLRVGEGEVRVTPELRDAITWRRLNLVDPAAVASAGTFDVILCRNVLIYFDDATTRQVVASLSACLRPGGVLFVGISESLLRFGTSLDCEERDGVFFYRQAV
jgi:chemotaxis protein methyltransferase CheR